VITVTRKGEIMVGKNSVADAGKLTPVLQQVLSEREDKTVYLEADKAVPYGKVVKVMAAIKRAGVAKLGMVAQEPQK
jgi:biopolymer transport protein TolR